MRCEQPPARARSATTVFIDSAAAAWQSVSQSHIQYTAQHGRTASCASSPRPVPPLCPSINCYRTDREREPCALDTGPPFAVAARRVRPRQIADCLASVAVLASLAAAAAAAANDYVVGSSDT